MQLWFDICMFFYSGYVLFLLSLKQLIPIYSKRRKLWVNSQITHPNQSIALQGGNIRFAVATVRSSQAFLSVPGALPGKLSHWRERFLVRVCQLLCSWDTWCRYILNCLAHSSAPFPLLLLQLLLPLDLKSQLLKKNKLSPNYSNTLKRSQNSLSTDSLTTAL